MYIVTLNVWKLLKIARREERCLNFSVWIVAQIKLKASDPMVGVEGHSELERKA